MQHTPIHHGWVEPANSAVLWRGICACGWMTIVHKNRANARAEMVKHIQAHA